jgi:AcrR family transcriptional regulator
VSAVWDDPVAERGALLAAAADVFAVGGFESIKVQSVLARTGLSTRAFYRHFPTKDHLWLAFWQDSLLRRRGDVQAVIDAHDDPMDQLLAWLDNELAVRCRPDTFRLAAVLRTLKPLFPTEVATALRDDLQPVVEVLRRGRALGTFPAVEPEADAVVLACMLSGVLLWDEPGTDCVREGVRRYVRRTIVAEDPRACEKPLPAGDVRGRSL